MPQQRLPENLHIPLIAPGNDGDIPFSLFQQLQQPVLNSNLGVSAGLAQRCGGVQRAGAERVEAA